MSLIRLTKTDFDEEFLLNPDEISSVRRSSDGWTDVFLKDGSRFVVQEDLQEIDRRSRRAAGL
jgi:uncharacterized protein YlzI (FlbEa/FlbD family)